MVSSYITKLSLAVGLLALVFVIGLWILATPQPQPITEQWVKAEIPGYKEAE